ncbi:MAG: HAD-IIB family hydrolase [Acidobacteriota bacterium]
MTSRGERAAGGNKGRRRRRGQGSELLVFTDLDGTLLDTDTYAWQPARPALDALKAAAALLIPCTSKTWAEVKPLRAELGLRSPAVVENGAAIFGDADTPMLAAAESCASGEWAVSLGPGRSRVLAGLARMRQKVRGSLRGLSEIGDDELTALTGLASSQLWAARERLHSEPFLADEATLEELEAAATQEGLHVTRGGRFFHLGGRVDKGTAARIVVEGYRRRHWKGMTAGLGDSLNDRSLLAVVRCPILIPRADGEHDPAVLGAARNLCLATHPGPEGWCEAVLALLDWNQQGTVLIE